MCACRCLWASARIGTVVPFLTRNRNGCTAVVDISLHLVLPSAVSHGTNNTAVFAGSQVCLGRIRDKCSLTHHNTLSSTYALDIAD